MNEPFERMMVGAFAGCNALTQNYRRTSRPTHQQGSRRNLSLPSNIEVRSRDRLTLRSARTYC